MERLAFKMYLKPGMEDEYERRHNSIWPELKIIIKKAGISDYSIFLDKETSTLFAFQKSNSQGGSQNMGSNEIVQKWWDYMADLMEVNEDNSPISIPLEELFHLE